ncbi:nucleoporin NUP188 homolog [Copidosoma floridanum]|uniref:nucleoporin NUP188 homolog n=1 Tax=Copidosoma floridanum TaxID=29053 RepID=UPI0006C9736F|nr:nucleoporin NUP188 homolog [Copidosoma floridanum]
MSMTPMGNLPYCKGLWSVISGTTCRCDKELVEDEIKNATELLKDGLFYFKPYTEASLQSVSKTNPPPKMYDLICKLAPLLNLDATIAWDLVCNYMIYEYRNCAETFASQLTDLTCIKALIENIWSFYYTERITLIKCLKLMVEYRENKNHPNRPQFVKFFDEILLGTLLESIRKQIEALKFINPPVRSQLFSDELLHQLYNSSLIEMRELLHVFTVILHEVHIAENEFVNIYGSISGEPRRLISSKSHEEKETIDKKIQEIQYSQTALLIVGLDMMKHAGMEDWIREVRSSMQEILEQKCLRDSFPQDGPLFLAWMLANYIIDMDNSDVMMRYKAFGIRAVQLNVFYYLHGLLNSEMIKEKTQYAITVRGSIHNLLTILCAFVDEDKLDIFPGVFEACAATLSFPEIAERFWQEKDEEGSVWFIVKYAIQWFPSRFQPLTCILTGLANASASSAEKTAKMVDSLPSITLEISRRNFIHTELRRRPYESECLVHPNTYEIPRNCEIVKLNASQQSRNKRGNDEYEIIMFKAKSSYWNAFHHKIELLLSDASAGISRLSESNNPLPEDVALGFGFLEALLATDIDISTSVVFPTELSFEVLNRFSYPVLPINVYKVVTACIKVTSKLVLRYPADVLSRMRAGIYPRFDNCYQDVSEFAQAVSFDGGLIASWLSSIETIQHTYPILDAYLDTLSNYLIVRHSKEALHTVEIPGMIMLLQSVLPKLDSWYFNSDLERIDLWLKSMYCLHRALDVTPGRKDESRNELRKIVTYNLLHLEPRHALLKLVRTGEAVLRIKMLSETDWISGKGFKVMKSVQLALSVVNRLLMYRKNLGMGKDQRTPLEAALYASPSLPNALLIVPTIVDYLYVWFSPELQAMAVRLLKKFAEGFSMSLLVCMGMDGTAIRETFASRLMSPTCGVEVKVAILELVTVCLDKQPGLTEALFNIMHQAERRRIFPRPADEFLTEGCTRFLDLYLERTLKEDDIVYDRLYDSTMNLLRAMWYHRNEILVNFFRKRPQFWSKLFTPLFRKLILKPEIRGYSQLLDIITLELFKSAQLEQEFTKNLEKLLDENADHWNTLTRYVFETVPPPLTEEQQKQEDPDEDEEQVISEREVGIRPLYENNLESWYQLLVVITRVRTSRNYSIGPKQVQLTTRLALDQLLMRLTQQPPTSKRLRFTEAKLIMLLSSITLRCMTSWRALCVGELNSGEDLKNKLLKVMQDIVSYYQCYGKPLRQTLVALILEWLELVQVQLTGDELVLEYLLSQACTLASSDIEELRKAAHARDKKRKPVSDTEEEYRREAEETLGITQCLPATLTTSLVTRLLKYKINQGSMDSGKKMSACYQLRHLVPELIGCAGVTLQKHPYAKFSKAALMLLSAIARSLYESLPVSEEDVSKLWLALVPPKDIKGSLQSCLYEKCMYVSYDNTVNLLLRPRILKFIIDGISVESAEELKSCDERQLSTELCLLVNKLILINTCCAQTFVRLSPRLYALFDTICVENDFWYAPMAEMNFGPPQMSITSAARLTYGTIISSTQLFTQAQWYTFRRSNSTFHGSFQRRSTRGCSPSSGSIRASLDGEGTDSARREWERATPDNLRRMQTKDLRKILHTSTSTSLSSSGLGLSVLASASSTSLRSTPRLIKRPFDPLICENMILSRATALVPLPSRSGVSHGSSPSAQTSTSVGDGKARSPSREAGVNGGSESNRDPWFDSMEENNTRLALEVNLMLILCQVLEGARSSRLTVRDRQLIVREAATELGVFFDFLEYLGQQLSEWPAEASLINPEYGETRLVETPRDANQKLPARLKEDTTYQKIPLGSFVDIETDELEKRSNSDIVTTGGFNVGADTGKLLPLLGKLLKSVVESLDSTQFGG